MAQIPSHQGPTDRARSTFDPTREVRYWTERLGVSPEDVRMAVRRVRAMMQGSRPGGER